MNEEVEGRISGVNSQSARNIRRTQDSTVAGITPLIGEATAHGGEKKKSLYGMKWEHKELCSIAKGHPT